MTYDLSPASPQRIELGGREHLSVTGEKLHIGKLSIDGGELHVDGRIDSLTFEDASAGRGGLLSRLLGG